MPGRTGSRLLTALGLGAVAGALSGLLGVGGGVILVPGMVALMGLGQRRAIANSLLAIIPISIAGAAMYYLAGTQHALRLDLAIPLAVGSAVAAPAGAWITHHVSARTLRIAFGVLSLLIAARLLIP